MADVTRLRQQTLLGAQIIAEREFGIEESLFFDVVDVESPRDSNLVSQHAQEKGADFNDHIQRQPSTLTLQGRFSNTPLPSARERMQAEGGLFADREIEGEGVTSYGRASLAYGWLLLLKEDKIRVDIVTGLRDYTNYVITDVAPNRQGGPGSSSRNTLDVTVSFQQINEVEAAIVQVDPSIFAEVVRPSATDEDDDGNTNLLSDRPSTVAFDLYTGGTGAVTYAVAGPEAAEEAVNAILEASDDPQDIAAYQQFLDEEDRDNSPNWPPPQ